MSAKVLLADERAGAEREQAEEERGEERAGEREARAGLLEMKEPERAPSVFSAPGASSQPVAHARARSRCARAARGVDLPAQARDQDVDRVATSAPPARPRPASRISSRETTRAGRAGAASPGSRTPAPSGRAAPAPRQASPAAGSSVRFAAVELGCGGPALVAAQERPGARRENRPGRTAFRDSRRRPTESPSTVTRNRPGAVSIRIELAKPSPAGAPADVQAVSVRQPAVEHEQVVVVELDELLRFLDARRLVAGESHPRQGPHDERPQPQVVLEHERSHREVCSYRSSVVSYQLSVSSA